MKQSTLSRYSTELALLCVVMIWGVNFVVVKLLLTVLHPHVMNLFRVGSSAVVLGWIYWIRQGRSLKRCLEPLRTDPIPILRLGMVGWAFYQIAFILGLNFTTAGNGALIMASAPLWTASLAMILGYERLSRIGWIGLTVSICGTITVVIIGAGDISLDKDLLEGNIIILAAAIMWGSYTTLTKPLVKNHSPLGLTVLSILVAFPVLVLVSIPYWGDVHWERLTFWYWFGILASGALSTGGAVVFWNSAVKKIGAAHTAAFSNLVPLFALISGVIILGDPLLPAQIIGGVAIVGGLVLMRRARTS